MAGSISFSTCRIHLFDTLRNGTLANINTAIKLLLGAEFGGRMREDEEGQDEEQGFGIHLLIYSIIN